MNLTDLTKQWQPFYSVLGGATATLVGLLFISLSMHSERIHKDENSHFLRLARQTFSTYLMLLLLSLQMLVPIQKAEQLIVPLMSVGIGGLGWAIYMRNPGLDKSDPNTRFLKRSNRMTIGANFMLIILGFLIRSQTESALYFMLGPVLALVVVSVRNSWGLMMMMRAKGD